MVMKVVAEDVKEDIVYMLVDVGTIATEVIAGLIMIAGQV
jgi:hypothetical protein